MGAAAAQFLQLFFEKNSHFNTIWMNFERFQSNQKIYQITKIWKSLKEFIFAQFIQSQQVVKSKIRLNAERSHIWLKSFKRIHFYLNEKFVGGTEFQHSF